MIYVVCICRSERRFQAVKRAYFRLSARGSWNCPDCYIGYYAFQNISTKYSNAEVVLKLPKLTQSELKEQHGIEDPGNIYYNLSIPELFHLPLTIRIFPSASAIRRYPVRVLQTPFLTLLSFFNKSSLSNNLSFQFDYVYMVGAHATVQCKVRNTWKTTY